MAAAVAVAIAALASCGDAQRSAPAPQTAPPPVDAPPPADSSDSPVVHDPTAKSANVYVVNLRSGRITAVTHSQQPEYNADFPAWSPDGARIAYTRIPCEACDGELAVTDPDGSNHAVIETAARNLFQPTWSPDGRRVAVARPETGLVAVRLSDGAVRRIASANGLPSPKWSPRDSGILFSKQTAGGDWDIFVASSDGGGARALTRGSAQDISPAWSPDGSRIAFARQTPAGVWALYVMRADGSGVRRITSGRASVQDPAWSPDGRRIAATSQTSDRTSIVVMQADGGGARLVTDRRLVASRPSWSPGGTKLAFSARRASKRPG